MWREIYIGPVVEEYRGQVKRLDSYRLVVIILFISTITSTTRLSHYKPTYGRFSTAWLCHDTKFDILRYLTLNFLKACETRDECRKLLVNELKAEAIGKDPGGQHIWLPIDQYEIQGPNGTHIWFTYPVLGHHVDLATNIFSTDEAGTVEQKLRDVAQQTISGITAAHNRGICHGGN